MLAYLIIGIELAILYTVFWYVFLREPRPYKIRENIWGYYPGAGQDSAHTDNGCRHCNSQADANALVQALRTAAGASDAE